MNNITFGQYYPVKSPVHNIDPRIKILMTVMLVVMIFLIKSFIGYAIIGAFILISIVCSNIPLVNILKSIRAILFLVIFTTVINVFFYKSGEVLAHWWIFTITKEGIMFALFMALRLIFLVVGTSLLTLTTTPMQLTDGIESLMAPLKLVKFPVHDIAIIMSIALRFIPSLMEETDKIMKAQKSRGASFDQGNIIKRAKALLPILIPLFVSSFRRADELALALDARCYNATPKRTKMKELKLHFVDLWSSLIILIFLAMIILNRVGII